jgi:tetratricopeptide (TPR) repeat protein
MTDEPRGGSGRGQRRPGGSSGRPASSRGGTSGERRGGTGGERRGGTGGQRGGGQRREQGRDQRSFERGPARGRDRAERTAEQAKYDGPDLPAEITGQELDRNVLAQLRGLPEKLAARVARHLVAAGQLIDTDPEAAYQHALAARSRAARVAVVREATGEAAYAAGHFAEALSELRAAKRMNGAPDYLPVMADCERALGRPERALELAKSPALAKLPDDQRIEMTIVEAGARFDLGEVDGALRTLENAPLRSIAREDWVVRLRYAYADLLLKAGRQDEAVEWFHRTAGIDSRQITDAAERIEELEGAGPAQP